jgi:seryl-tRNA synthetase
MTQAPASTEQPPVATPPAAAQTTETVTEHMIPKSRLDEVLQENKRLKDEQAARDEKARKETEARAKAQGEWEKLATDKDTELTALKPQLQTAQERLAAYEQLMTDEIKERMKALPDEIKAMKPDGDVLQQRTWLQKAEAAAAKLSIARSPGTPAGPTGSGGTSTPHTTVEEIAARKRASGVY